MKKQIRPIRDVLSTVKAWLVSNPKARADRVLEGVVQELYGARGYFWIGIYLAGGDKVIRQCFRGPEPPCHSFALGVGNVGTAGQTGITKVIPDVSTDSTYSMCFRETKSEIVQPIKIAARILGVIDVESDRLDAFGRQEAVLLEQVARMVALYLTTNKGKLLMRKAREQSQSHVEAEPHKRPQSERLVVTQAAAGERSAR